ncbi:MAG: response regulator [Phormidesmis sp.]
MSSSALGRVLILEIDYSNRILFADYLEHCGYRVLPLSDEQQVFESLEVFQPDLLILNLRLPVIDGLTIIEQLRSHTRWHALPVLVVSGYVTAENQRKAYQVGANAYLTKPILPHDLSAAVAQLLS